MIEESFKFDTGLFISPTSDKKQLLIDICEFFIEKKVAGETVYMRQLFSDFFLPHALFVTMFTYGLLNIGDVFIKHYSDNFDSSTEDLRKKYLHTFGTLRISANNAPVYGTELLSIVYINLLNGKASHVSNDVVETLDFV